MTLLYLRARLAGAICIAFAGSFIASLQAPAQSQPPHPVISVAQSAHGLDAVIDQDLYGSADNETLHLIVCSDSVIHVIARPDGRKTEHPQPWLLPPDQSCKGARFQFARNEKTATLKTARITVTLNLEPGRDLGKVDFFTSDGKKLVGESGYGVSIPRSFVPATLDGERTFHVVQRFILSPTEAIYGLGQHQNGMFNYRGGTVELGQNNTDIAIPFLVSTNGYGILWNTAASTYVDNRFPVVLNFDSMAGDGVDYFLIYGPEMDHVIHQYRNLTGHVPMLPRWAFGYLQSKNRYKSLDEIIAIANRYRKEKIPLDAMVQDWFWWRSSGEGEPTFNDNYRDVPASLAVLHSEHVHTMISTWPLFDPGTENYKKLLAVGGLILPATHLYDASNSEACDLYWSDFAGTLFAQGWDSFWLDNSEPGEAYPHASDAILRDKKIHLGSGALYTNIYPFLHGECLQKHWLRTTDQKRVFLLNRSAFLGSQRLGQTVWSGDDYSSYWGFSRQVSAGLNYALSGLPYWTTDIGGEIPLFPGQSVGEAYPELYLRWFEYGVFCPIFRAHGHRPFNEIWSYPSVEHSLIAYDDLRYRMLPYIYSLAWKVSSDDYTIQRPLVMDWRSDPVTWNIGNQFMFGPALLVNPVTEANATERRVYLPTETRDVKKTLWYDFWTGSTIAGGVHIQAPAPFDQIPLYVRAGSIFPLGPIEQYANEKVAGPIELRIYPGANGRFTLYQDEGDNYNYEKGKHAIIPIEWSDSSHTLTFEARTGSYANMPAEMIFHIVRVRPGHGTGGNVETSADKTVIYKGSEIRINVGPS
jgi:alpha-D-xyloside xylohydrolase